MKNALVLLGVIVGFSMLCNAQMINHEVKPKGVFAEIAVEKQNAMLSVLLTGDEESKSKAAKDVMLRPHDYNPPVIYALSRQLFKRGEKDEASFWFYVAQLRARYDVNLCLDLSAHQAVATLNSEYGPDINNYAFQDIEKLATTVKKAVDFVRDNDENYDQRWLSLHGMKAVLSGLDEGSEVVEICKPRAEWASIKKNTIEQYYQGFLEVVKSMKK